MFRSPFQHSDNDAHDEHRERQGILNDEILQGIQHTVRCPSYHACQREFEFIPQAASALVQNG
jgi:hypothetical protein